MYHTVSIADTIDPNDWMEIAKFRWHADAYEYAKEISRSDHWGKGVRIRSETFGTDTHFKEGKEIGKKKIA